MRYATTAILVVLVIFTAAIAQQSSPFAPPPFAADPATCTVGQLYRNTSDSTTRACIATNTWQKVVTSNASGTVFGKLPYWIDFPGGAQLGNGYLPVNTGGSANSIVLTNSSGVIDPSFLPSTTATYVTCAHSSGTNDAATIQAAIDAAPTSNTSTPTPTVIQITPGTCYIGTTVLLRKAGVILRGSGGPVYQGICSSSNCVSHVLNAATVFACQAGLSGAIVRADAGDVTSPSTTTYLVGVGIQDLAFDSTACTSLTNYQVETGSLSNPAPFKGLTFYNHHGGGILFGPSLTSTSTYSVNPYPPEGVVLENFLSIANGNTSVHSAVSFIGANQSIARDGRIASNQITASGTISDVGAVEVNSTNYFLASQGVTLDNLTGGGYPVWVRVNGADNNRTPCSTPPSSGGCAVAGTHIAPQGLTITHNFVELFNRAIVIGEESNGSGGARTPADDVIWERTNRVITSYGSSPKLASVDWMQGGEISSGYIENYFANPTIVLGSTTANILCTTDWNANYSAFSVSSSSANNHMVATAGPVTFAQLPTGAPSGTALTCSNCSCASGSTCSSGSAYRGVVWNGSNWVGQ